MYTLPDPLDLFWLFETDPELLDEGVILAYNTLTYRTVRGDDEVVCILSPAIGDVEVWWSRNGTELARVDMQAVHDVRVVRYNRSEVLEVISALPGVGLFSLQLKPSVHLGFGTEDSIEADS